MSIRFLNRGGEKIADYIITTMDTTHATYSKLIKKFPPLTLDNLTSLAYAFGSLSNLTEIPEMDTSNVTNFNNTFAGCSNLETVSQLNTSSGTIFTNMFQHCSKLKTVPQLDLSQATAANNTFQGCSQLTSESLNNILASLTNATNITNKTLSAVGLTQAQAQTCVTLSNYAAFKAAGWKTGYTAIDDAPEYTKLEYIQGTGTQYLDTGITPKATQRIEIEVQLDAVTAWERLYGVTKNGAVTRADVYANDADNQGKMDFFVVRFKNGYAEDDVPVKIPMVINTKYKVDVNYATKEVKLDDVSLGYVTEAPDNNDNRTIQVFSGADSDVAPAKMKLYSFKIYEGDELVLDLIPVKRNSDNVVCAYDTVSEEYFTNEGTGVFTAGAEVEA